MVEKIRVLAQRLNGYTMETVLYGFYFLTLIILILAALFGVNGSISG